MRIKRTACIIDPWFFFIQRIVPTNSKKAFVIVYNGTQGALPKEDTYRTLSYTQWTGLLDSKPHLRSLIDGREV